MIFIFSLTNPGYWNGRNLTTFDVAAFIAALIVCIASAIYFRQK